MISNFITRLTLSHYRVSSRSISYFVSTPIYYVNSSPHIGHVHTLFLADALNVYQKLRKAENDSIFSTGTDEHGIKIQTAAETSGMSCKTFCDLNTGKFYELFKHYDTTVTDFVRTTEERHILAVRKVWRELNDGGYIYKSTYSGWYCTSDEVFVPESLVARTEINGRSVHVDQNNNELVWSSEENYMFRVDSVKEKVCKWLVDEKPVVPEKFNEDAIRMIKDTQDISISRPKDRLGWGISVPNDPDQTIYVWLDALTNYLTVAGYANSKNSLKRWPPDCQVIGKDIIRFHAIYWPAFLCALSLEFPRKLLCHSHWLVDSIKMSKSKGNVIDPWKESSLLTREGLRYYLLRCSTTHSDNDYNRTQALRRINSELSDTYGNLMSRCCAPAINPSQDIPKNLVESSIDGRIRELTEQLNGLASECAQHYENADFYKGVDLIMAALRRNNALYEELKPWKLVKEINSNQNSSNVYNNLQAVTFESLRICSILLKPIVPTLTARALSWLGVREVTWQDARVMLSAEGLGVPKTSLIKEPKSVLFSRIKSS